ncbi:MAG TPA: SRPBCC family protein [Gemmatimonadaceae bacterium]|nr:SRPBCC family protein [Gemmatimonadaceae bacterium]
MRQFTTIDINAPAARVWSVMSDVLLWHEWTPTVRSITRLDSGPFRIGSRAFIRQPGFPPAFWKATAVDPGRAFTWVSGAPGMRVVASHSVDAIGDTSRATLSLEFQGLLGPWFGRLTAKINQKYLDLEAKGLKARSEDPYYRHSGGL